MVLGSASPRRRDLLHARGIDFVVVSADVDESFEPHADPDLIAGELAERKALAISELAPVGTRFILAGDTLVVVDQPGSQVPRYLGKPDSPEAAGAMLASLSGTTHRVVTGVAVLCLDGELLRSGAETTFVTMRTISPAEIDSYVASGEWRGKAGGYAIQESADQFVERLEGGGFDNVVGLPVNFALDLLASVGWVDADGRER